MVVSAAFVAVSCSKQPVPLVERVAVLRFDNLTGDQSLDWMATAAPAILSAEWNGASRKLALLAGTVRDGYLEGATRLAHGYFEKRGGKLQFRIVLEDASLHKTTADTTAEGDPLTAMNSIARRIEPAANSFSTTNAEAIEAWGHGNFERAVSIDPDFSGAWLAWVETLVASGDSQRAADVGSQALMRSSLRSPVDRARIELSVAAIRRNQSASIMALEKLAQLAPFDSGALRRLAEANFAARRFQEAERTYRDLIRIEPADAASLNALGYVLALAGEPEKARAEFEEYGKRSGQAVNALDSTGEGMFLNGKFQEAEKAFLGSYQKDPTFFDGAALWKAAHARWLGGDLRGADTLIEQYTEARTKAHDPLAGWRRAVWLYETGRREQAVALLSQPNSQAPDSAPVVAMMQQQLAVWRDPRTALGAASVEQLKQLYERTEPVNDGMVRTLYAAALLGSGSNEDAGRKDDARKLLALWPLPPRMSSPLESLVYPQFLDLRKKLG